MRARSTRIALLALFVAAASPARGQDDVDLGELLATQAEIDVSAVVSAPRVMLGKAFSVFVTAVHEPGLQVSLPTSFPLGDALELGRRTSEHRARDDGMGEREFEIEIIAWDVGELAIPPIPVTYTAAGTVHTVYTEPMAIQVIGLVNDTDEVLRDIAPPVAVYSQEYVLLYYVAAVVAALAVAWLLLWRVRAARARVAPMRVAMRAPADREALARLAELEASGALTVPDRKPAFVAMSEIVRVYLGRRFGLSAMDATTSELETELASRRDTAELCEVLGPWLAHCDLVKYAGAHASEDEARHALDTARRLIERTRPEDQGRV